MRSTYTSFTWFATSGACLSKNRWSGASRASRTRWSWCTLLESRCSSSILSNNSSPHRAVALPLNFSMSGARSLQDRQSREKETSASPSAAKPSVSSRAATASTNESSTAPSQMTDACRGSRATRFRKPPNFASAARLFLSLVAMDRLSDRSDFRSRDAEPKSASKPRSRSCISARMPSHRWSCAWRSATLEDCRT